MNNGFHLKSIPRNRIATFDILSLGILKHHISALLEFDVTESRKRLKELRRNGTNISFNAWLVKVIAAVLQMHPEAAAYLFNKKKLILFNNINISFLVEKNINGNFVPIPVVLEKANIKSALELSKEIEDSKNIQLSAEEIVLKKRATLPERMYYYLPGFIRRAIWKIMLNKPKFVYKKMGNASITSIGMIGKINGWFIHKSVHPISFGIGSIIKKPVVIENEIKIREILNMTILVDHDVIDGAPMVRLLNDLTKYIESGEFIETT
jgi:pyruvate/2-oxoglutarate dehydrogenase complex dihydrolipoamide acyltransferase (E2) component